MRISGYAYTKDAKEVARKRKNQFEALSGQGKIEIESIKRRMSSVTYRGRAMDESLTPLDVALICDKGNLCFGGICSLSIDGTFICEVYTD